MTDEELNALYVKVRENRNKLDNCPRHHFKLPEPPYTMNCKWPCRNCGGEMSGVEINQYYRGYIAAGGNGLDVIGCC